MSKFALTVENLTKIYSNSKTKKENTALNELNFEVKQGEVFGLLGPNGAGKTTSFYMIVVMLRYCESNGTFSNTCTCLDYNESFILVNKGI